MELTYTKSCERIFVLLFIWRRPILIFFYSVYSVLACMVSDVKHWLFLALVTFNKEFAINIFNGSVSTFKFSLSLFVCFVWDLINKSSNVTIKQQRANETKCRNKAISCDERENRKRLVQNFSHRSNFTQKWRVKNGKFIHNSTHYGFIGFFWAHLAYCL